MQATCGSSRTWPLTEFGSDVCREKEACLGVHWDGTVRSDRIRLFGTANILTPVLTESRKGGRAVLCGPGNKSSPVKAARAR